MPAAPAGKLNDPAWRRARARKAGRARTTPDYHIDRVRELVEASRAKQGLPPAIVDELTLGEIARIVADSEDGDRAPAA